MNPRLLLLALLAILAFAGNSLFARAALAGGMIDAASYSVIRLGAGALVLLPLLRSLPKGSDWPGALALFAYAILFGFAYLGLSTATGALILFASVQASILIIGAARGDRPGTLALIGVAMALAGIGWLFAPGAGAPEPVAALLMAGAGCAWGVYTLIGRGAASATRQTATSFLLATLLSLPLLLIASPSISTQGAVLAALSGAITSGLGYVAWYMVAPRLGIATVAAVQLMTPVAAGLLAWPLLGEAPSGRLALGALLILGGIVLTLPISYKPSSDKPG